MILFTSFSFRSPPLCLCVIILPPARVPNRAGEYQIVRKKRHRKKSVPLLKVLINLFQKVAVSKGRAFCRRPQTAKRSRRFSLGKARSRRLLFSHCACYVKRKGVNGKCTTSPRRKDNPSVLPLCGNPPSFTQGRQRWR